MTEQRKSLYFIEETERIEGAYVEINTLYVIDNESKAKEIYQTLLTQEKKFLGLLLSEYVVEADDHFFNRILKAWRDLPAEFYRRMKVITYQAVLEYQPI
ncbi:hypothetical protein KUA55_15090 [Enterococcus sp. ALS3]|uniref:Phenylalanyl-tRNA synthetase subunit alpha n=1 Tax=Enterococcus alishanensis TaxID=1303817 RepID=A0ABS6TGI0_9ENTE|nr:hypothetical protein [Enterococcus alishanensis]MBV7392005.1 hypothetical protein [Enterococcus alishanensis]